VDQIQIRDVRLEGVAVPVSIQLNWNPQYSYATIPSGMTQVPEYWRILAEPVPLEKGLPHLRNVQILHLLSTQARRAFDVGGYPSDPIRDFRFDHVQIEAQTAGTIADASDWVFQHTEIRTADGSHIKLTDCHNIIGIKEQ